MRTDRTYLCGYCALRFSPRKTCPTCGAKRIYDLTRRKGRYNGSKMLRRRRKKGAGSWIENMFFLYFEKVSLPLSVLVLMAFIWLMPNVSLGAQIMLAAFCVFGAPVTLMVAGSYAHGQYTKLRSGSGKERPRLPTIELAALPEASAVARRQFVYGIVRIAKPIDSPLGSQPCAAFRVVGHGPTGKLDEAGLTEFDVIDDDGALLARVEGTSATVEMEVTGDPKQVDLKGPALRFFRHRGAMPHLGPLYLAETTLREGMRVELEGTAEDRQMPGGYRDAQFVRIFSDHDDSPLVVRTP